MCVLRSGCFLLVSLLVTGCVSLSRYNDRGAQVKTLRGEISSLEETLQQSESAKRSLKFEAQQAREQLARLEDEHEALKAKSTALAPASGEGAAVDAERGTFAKELAELRERLVAADVRIGELSTALAAKEEAAKKVPLLEAAVTEREERIREVTESLRKLETTIAQLKQGAVELSRKRETNEEKDDTFAAIRARLKDEIDRGDVVVKLSRDKFILTMKEQVLFPSGSARINRTGERTLKRIAKVLKRVNSHQILVVGHTDSAPIRKRLASRYQTNWDLAAARAANVVSYLEKKGEIQPKLLALAGYGCYLPAAANDCEARRKLNRRIEIALVPLETERSTVAGKKTAMR